MQYKQLVRAQKPKARAKKFAAGWVVFVPVVPLLTLGVGRTAADAWRSAANTLSVKRRRTRVRDYIDQIIDWYEQNKKPCPAIKVSATANTIRKFARKRRGEYRYRDQVIRPLRATQTKAEIQSAKARGSLGTF